MDLAVRVESRNGVACGDRIAAVPLADGYVIVVADGAGGQAGAAEAAATCVIRTSSLARANARLGLSEICLALHDLDLQLQRDPEVGLTSAIVISVCQQELYGASVGDSQAWLVDNRSVDVVTERQKRRPLLGSGDAIATVFERTMPSGLLVVATESLFNFAPRETIVSATRCINADAAARRLIDSVRLPGGIVADDVAIAVMRLG